AINEGRLHPDDEFYNAGSRIFGDTIILNAINIAPGMYSYKDMISQSINTGSVAALESLSDNNAIDQQSKQTWYQYMTSVFGFSEYTGAATIEDKGYIPLVDSPFSTQARYAFSSHGIGITVTPMQLTSAYSTLLNHGKYITPKLFSKNNSYRSTLITDQTSSTMQHMLFLATERSNTKALHQGYVMGGKSGTGPSADVSGLYQYYRSNGVYVGYVGKDNPEYIVLAKIDEPEDDQVLASRFAADLWTLQINDIIKEL
ncbi:hypothetical protein KDA11_04040, partial [Candidatus Saccharibacteria bacterium]|nr:hypothetical protein [Candidatus Saccharibacteria bacterium]